MHLYDIKMKEGTEYKNVMVTDEKGFVGDSLTPLIRDDPRVNISMHFRVPSASSDSKIMRSIRLSLKLLEIDSAVCKGERVKLGVLMDIDELPMWLLLHNTYMTYRADIDALPEDRRKAKVGNLMYNLYTIRMKDGTEYKNVLLTDEKGVVGYSCASIMEDDPRVHFKDNAHTLHSLNLLEIDSVVSEVERAKFGAIKDTNELPRWLELHKIYLENKQEIDALPEGKKKVSRAFELLFLKRQ